MVSLFALSGKYLWEQDCKPLLSGQLVCSPSCLQGLICSLHFPFLATLNIQVSSCEGGRGSVTAHLMFHFVLGTASELPWQVKWRL